MRLQKIIKMFESGNVCVTGLRGTGKDLLFGNVIARRTRKRQPLPYASNLNYGGNYIPLDFKDVDCGGNTFAELIEKDVYYYEYPYPYGADVYISDCGIYFPAQFCNKLNECYKGITTYQALSRQVSGNNFHVNSQNLNRVWDKIREQSDIYIRCRKCIYIPFLNIVIQFITLYDKAQSCVERVAPCRVSAPLFANKQVRMQAECHKDSFFNTYGSVKNRVLIYHNKSKHDTYYFREVFKNGTKKREENKKNK